MRKSLLAFIIFSLSSSPQMILAGGVGTSGGLTLLEASSARSAALGEAYSAVRNDIDAFSYNPASLPSLKTAQASFLYHRGLADDGFGQFQIGSPLNQAGVGLAIGYYDGGSIDLFDGVTERSVSAQRDLSVSLGYAKNVGRASIGVTGKYLSTELIESVSARAYAADFGVNMVLNQRMQLGVAFQNIGTQLRFENEGDNLPRIFRTGVSVLFKPSGIPTTLLIDTPYFMNEQELRPALGLEAAFGVLSIRAGYKTGTDLEEFSIGTGFLIGRSSLDYSFGMVDSLDSRHRVSLSMRFNGFNAKPNFVKTTPQPAPLQLTEAEPLPEPKTPEIVEQTPVSLPGPVWFNEVFEKDRNLLSSPLIQELSDIY